MHLVFSPEYRLLMSSTSASYPAEESSGPSINENWASPSELLEMRTMWSAIVSQHKAEVAALQAALERSHQQQQVYLKELQETQRLRNLYSAAASDQVRIVEERKVWVEERAMLQQEIQRLRLARSDESSTTRTATASDGSYSSVRGELLRVSQEENVALHEALARYAREKNEIEQRLLFIQSAYSQQQRGLELQVQTLTANLTRSEKRVGMLNSELERNTMALDRSNTIRTDLEAEVDKLRMELANQLDAIEREKLSADTELADRLSSQKAKLSQSAKEKEATLMTELKESNQAREAMREQLDRCTAARSAEALNQQEKVDGYEREIAELRMRLRCAEEEKLLNSRSSQQMLLDAQERLQFELESKTEISLQRTTLQMRIDGLEAQLSLLEADCTRSTADNEHLRSHIGMLMEEINCLRDDAAQASTAKEAITKLSDEIVAQKDFYERQIMQHTKAMEILQSKHGEDKKTLLQIISQKRSKSKTKRPATLPVGQENDFRQQKSNKQRGDLAVDALQLMRLNAQMAEQCANAIQKA